MILRTRTRNGVEIPPCTACINLLAVQSTDVFYVELGIDPSPHLWIITYFEDDLFVGHRVCMPEAHALVLARRHFESDPNFILWEFAHALEET